MQKSIRGLYVLNVWRYWIILAGLRIYLYNLFFTTSYCREEWCCSFWYFPFSGSQVTSGFPVSFFLKYILFLFTYFFPVSPEDISASITQPAAIIAYLENSLNINCTHTFSNYYYLYWYQQNTQEKALKLIGHLYTTTFNSETGFERFRIYGNAQSHGTLQITKINAEDTAVYFCAVSDTVHQDPSLYNINTSHQLKIAAPIVQQKSRIYTVSILGQITIN